MPSPLPGLLKPLQNRVPGPAPSFDSAQFVLAFLTVGASGGIGRSALARSTGLGEGAVRTVLRKLRASGYVGVDASGCHLTPSGVAAYTSLTRRLSGPIQVNRSKLTVGTSQVALSVTGGGRNVRGGIEQRDSAVKAGASGATTCVMKGRKFAMPGGSSDCEKEFPDDVWRILREKLKPKDGDAIILCGSGDDRSATLGALSAALTLL